MNSPVTTKQEPTLVLPDLVVPTIQQAEGEGERSGNRQMDEHTIGCKVPLLMIERNVNKDNDDVDITDKDCEKKISYVDYNMIQNINLNLSGKYPEVDVTIANIQNFNCTVGNKLYICIVPFTQDCGYDKIKLQFVIDDKTDDNDTIRIHGSFYVDNMYNSYPIYYNDKNSYDIAVELTKELGLGFRSNVDTIEDTAYYKSNNQIIDTLFSIRYGKNMSDLFDIYIDEYNCVNLVNMYDNKTNIETDFNMILDVDNESTDNDKKTALKEMSVKFSNYKEFQMAPTFIQDYTLKKLSAGANSGDSFIYRYVNLDEFGMPTVENKQLEYEESDGKVVLITLDEHTLEDTNNEYVNKAILDNMNDKVFNKLFAKQLVIDTKFIFGLRRGVQIPVEIWLYDGIKKGSGKKDESGEELDESEFNSDTKPTKDLTLTGQYMILSYDIYYEQEKGEIRAKYTMFKVA